MQIDDKYIIQENEDGSLDTIFGKAKINKTHYKITSRKEGNHNKSLHRLIYEDCFGEIPKGYVIHHIDKDPTNNRIDNLSMMKDTEHITLHNVGNSIWKGRKHSVESKKRMSLIKQGKSRSRETKLKISETRIKLGTAKGKNNPMYGRTGKNNPNYGKPLSEEHKQKISESRKGIYVKEKAPMWGTSIIDEWGGIWFLKEMKKQVKTLSKVTEYTGISRNAISGYLRNRNLKWSTLLEA